MMHARPIKENNTTSPTFSGEQKTALLQRTIEMFCPRYAPQAQILALNDPEQAHTIYEQEKIDQFGIAVVPVEILPDLLLYQEKQQIIFLVEMITSHGIITTEKKDTWENYLAQTQTKRIYVTIFTDLNDYARYVPDIAWKSYCWIAQEPGHTILHW